MSGFIKGKTPAQRAWIRGRSTERNFQSTTNKNEEVMSNCDWLQPLHPVDHARHSRFDFPGDASQKRGHILFPPRENKPR